MLNGHEFKVLHPLTLKLIKKLEVQDHNFRCSFMFFPARDLVAVIEIMFFFFFNAINPSLENKTSF